MFKMVSDWIEIEYVPDDEIGEMVPVFFYNDEPYSLSRFIRCHNNPWIGNMGVPDYIHAYDSANDYRPYYIEVSNDGEGVRLYMEVEDANTV